jgi:hypothetical protein
VSGDSSDSLGQVAIELSRLLAPLQEELAPGNAKGFFAQLGIAVTEAQAGALAAPLNVIVTKTDDLVQLTPIIIGALVAEQWDVAIEKGLLATARIAQVIVAIDDLADTANGMAIPDAASIGERMFNFLLARYLDSAHGLNDTLEFLGILDRQDFDVDSADPNNSPYTIYTYDFGAIGEWLSDPADKSRTLYGWGPGFDGSLLFPRLERFLAFTGVPVLFDSATVPRRLDVVFFELSPTTAGPPGLVIRLKDAIATGPQTISLGDEVQLEVQAEFSPPDDTELKLLTDGSVSFTPPSLSSSMSGRFGTRLIVRRQNPPDPFVIFGVAGGSRFEFREFILGTTVGARFAGGVATGDLDVSGALNGGKVVIDATSGDGFLTKILPGTRIEADFSFVMGVSTERGFYFSGSSALEIRLPLHIEIGPVSLEGLTIEAALEDGEIPLSLGADIRALLGPVEAVVQNMGVRATLSFPPRNQGNLGPMQLDLGFKPPNGVGLRIDAGPITGGGFLSLDFDKGEYFGALELSFEGTFTLKAVGIINTKMPDGSKGFALLILVTAEFTPIQLGFGFTLIGVGGLLGLNRSLDSDALRRGVKTGAVTSILFPPDVVGNILRIISDLQSFFPLTQGHFVVAPMGKIGYGTPALITLELGIILDIPVPQLTIIGVLRCILPEENAPVLKLQVNFAGGVDFDRGLIWFDASLFDSTLLVFTLEGDMALRIGWGERSIFVITVGGFHPAFKEVPDDLTGLRRLTIALLSGGNPRLTAKTYFALTSNSLQSGAKVELYAAGGGFNLYGFLGYDLLVQFSPFRFIADIYAGLALRAGTDVICGVKVRCQLSGPQPWNVNGEASVDFFFFSVTVGFDETWGDRAPSLPQERVNVLERVVNAIRDDRNWRALLPANSTQTVTVRKTDTPPDEVLLHPFGVLAVSQKIAPLDYPIERFGNARPTGDKTFTLSWPGASTQEVREEFAITNFVTLSDSQKLSRKSFEKMKAGLRFSAGDGAAAGTGLQKDVTYERSYVRRDGSGVTTTQDAGIMQLPSSIFRTLTLGGAITQNKLSVARRRAGGNGPAAVDVADAAYQVVKIEDLSPVALGAASEAEAFALHDSLVRDDPALAGTLQVMASHELHMASAA